MKATHRLSDISVRFVSLVGAASVRDPSSPDEPMRFVLRKSEKQKKRDKGVTKMAKSARQVIKKLDAGQPVSGDDVRGALRAATAEIRKADPSLSEYEAAVQAVRENDDLYALQQRYSEVTNPTAAEMRKAEAEHYGVPGVRAEAAVRLRKAAAGEKRPGETDYDAMLRELRANPERYREAA